MNWKGCDCSAVGRTEEIHVRPGRAHGRSGNNLQTCICEVLGSTLDQDTGYHDSGYSWFSSIPASTSNPNLDTGDAVQIPAE